MVVVVVVVLSQFVLGDFEPLHWRCNEHLELSFLRLRADGLRHGQRFKPKRKRNRVEQEQEQTSANQ